MTTYEELRQRHLADAGALAPDLSARLEWPPERLAGHRRDALRRLVRVARDMSPWHRERLAGVDPDEVTEEALAELPVMTKDDLMGNFDEIVTDDRLTLGTVEAHLAGLTTDAYLFERYHACASGGSSGRRGVFVYDWDGWATVYLSLMRHPIRALRADPALAGVRPTLAIVAAAAPTHMTSSAPQTFTNPQLPVLRIPVTRPVAAIVAELNAARPTLLCGYASVLHELAAESRAGRLRIAPAWVIATSEPLLPETRAALTEAFGVPVGNWYGTSEAGGNGSPCRHSTHLADDLMINELVDADGRPVPAGTQSDKLFLTNLYNTALPLDEVAAGLCRVGVPAPRVTVETVDRIGRPASGKLARFVRLADR